MASTMADEGTTNGGKDWRIPFESITDQKHLGSGGEGDVYSGLLHGQMVAVKKFRSEKKREFDNIDELGKLQHKNIIQFIGICIGEASYGIVMPYCSMGSLKDVLHSSETVIQITPPRQITWAMQIAEGMNYLHNHNPQIMHRDLKPANVLIADGYVVKITDFGIFRKWSDQESITMTFCGTPEYMSPELIRGEKCSLKVDVWSYGVVLWELLTGNKPYKGLTSHAVWWGVANNNMHLDIPDTLPEDMKMLIQECWLKISKRRPSFKDILSRLNKNALVPGSTTSIGKQFFLAFPLNPWSGHRYILLSNANMVPTDVQVKSSFSSFTEVSFTIPPGSSQKVSCPRDIQAIYKHGAEVFDTEQKGIFVNSAEPLHVTMVSGAYDDPMDGLLAFQSSALGTLFYPITASITSESEGCQIIAVATEDSTQATFTRGSTIKHVELSRMDIQTLSLTGEDLTGTKVESSKPIAVYSSQNSLDWALGHFAMCAAVPVHALGFHFPMVSLLPEGGSGAEYIKIVAAEPYTAVIINGIQKTVIGNQGGWHRYEIPPGSSHFLTTSKPSAVAQEANRGKDLSILNVASDTQFITGKHLFKTLMTESDAVKHFIIIITYHGHQDHMHVDGTAIKESWTGIGTSEFCFTRVPLLRGDHTVECTDPAAHFTAALVEFHFDYSDISCQLVGITLRNANG